VAPFEKGVVDRQGYWRTMRAETLALPIGGIVADIDVETMAVAEARLDAVARRLGGKLPSAFGYLMFLEITSIPDYAITDLGLVGVRELAVLDPVLGPG